MLKVHNSRHIFIFFISRQILSFAHYNLSIDYIRRQNSKIVLCTYIKTCTMYIKNKPQLTDWLPDYTLRDIGTA